MSPRLRLVLAACAGLLAAAAFEPLAWAAALVPAVAGLSLAVAGTRGRVAFGTGLVFGLAFMGALLPWLRVIGTDAWIGLSLLQAAFYGVLGVVVARVDRLPGGPAWTACAWVGVEVLRSSVPWGGFPWGRLAFATVDTPVATAMGWVGTAGTTFLVALLGTTLAWLLRDRRWRRRTPWAVAVFAVALAVLPAAADPARTVETTGSATVTAVQGNVPGAGMDAFAERRAVLDNHVRATLDLARDVERGSATQPDLVLWPENSTDIDPFEDPTVFADIQRAVDAVGVPVLVGAMVGGPGPVDVRNQGIVWSPGTGPGESYSKTHPVPFGEYIPHREALAKLFERLDQIPRDMVPGTEPGVLEVAGTVLGDVICFEVAYDGLVRQVVEGGAELLVVQTNNATYMGTGQVEQQFAIARLRAVETGRFVAVVATNGVSGFVGPDGTVLQRPPVEETAVFTAEAPLREGLTPAVRWGRWVEAGLAGAALAALAASFLPALGGRRRDGGTGPGSAVRDRVVLGAGR